jgi:LPXTG-motif cell wall-anchored protein
MSFDIRKPIGGLFCVIGALLVLSDLRYGASVAPGSTGSHVNLWTGLLMLLAGGIALVTVFRRSKS